MGRVVEELELLYVLYKFVKVGAMLTFRSGYSQIYMCAKISTAKVNEILLHFAPWTQNILADAYITTPKAKH
jgi:hypothetical protein